MQEYSMKIKSICDNLVNCGEKISEQEHITAVLNGLPPEFDSVITVISASPSSNNLASVSSILLDADVRQTSIFSLVSASAHVATAHNSSIEHVHPTSNSDPSAYSSASSSGYNAPNSGFGQSQSSQTEQSNFSYNNRGRGRGCVFSNNRPQCQICGKIGHLADMCYFRYNLNYKNNEAGRGTNIRSPTPTTHANVSTVSVPVPHVAYNPIYHPSSSPINPFSGTATPPSQQVHPSPSIIHAPQVSQPLPQYVLPQQPSVLHHASSFAYFPQFVAPVPQFSPQVHLATSDVLEDNSWYHDSGATHHLTNDASAIQDGTSGPGSCNVQVASGHTLSVKQLGQASFLSNNRMFALKQLLFVPKITKNFVTS
ncbi:hypothetical protein HRI_004058300 [Hibiscus trionum]|uniref:Retrovirus-related Pol polyprotein from transposon TNT 1-94-like beta-barrel domain-containing protein n=1 Tax=Hibiscus trionum TaxID=183268 RepID=A0A9W7IWH7_HIBTR|nr:hypothetical protein HRI_004058300 [Hibiscus trionum]